jgi:predicted transcriptional regulator
LLQVLAEPPVVKGDEAGFTSYELAERLGRSHGQVSRDLSRLVRAGRLTVAKARRQNIVGGIFWKPVYRIAQNVNTCA